MNAPREMTPVPPPATPAGRARAAAVVAACLLAMPLLGLGGCSIEPWVKPYDRERLADPIMKPGRDVLAEKHHEHIYDVREGARGATGVQGGGCGCN
jgi:nitroreductase